MDAGCPVNLAFVANVEAMIEAIEAAFSKTIPPIAASLLLPAKSCYNCPPCAATSLPLLIV
jgi:hypothetical protein